MSSKWCVTAVGINGQRVVLDRDLSHERADELRKMLAACNVFQAVYIVQDRSAASS